MHREDCWNGGPSLPGQKDTYKILQNLGMLATFCRLSGIPQIVKTHKKTSPEGTRHQWEEPPLLSSLYSLSFSGLAFPKVPLCTRYMQPSSEEISYDSRYNHEYTHPIILHQNQQHTKTYFSTLSQSALCCNAIVLRRCIWCYAQWMSLQCTNADTAHVTEVHRWQWTILGNCLIFVFNAKCSQ